MIFFRRRNKKIRVGDRIGVLTSGGDCPGMNAALRGIIMAGHAAGLEVLGIKNGYQGLIDGNHLYYDHFGNIYREIDHKYYAMDGRRDFISDLGQAVQTYDHVAFRKMSYLDKFLPDERGFLFLKPALMEGLKLEISLSLYPLGREIADELISRGGTLLDSSRCDTFKTPAGFNKALSTLREHQIQGVIVLGGDGSMRGALKLNDHLPTVGIPSSIDNDVWGTEMALGVDTAVNTIVESCDKISDTAASHHRTFVVEVMGRDCGYLAVISCLAAGADAVVFRERNVSEESIINEICRHILAEYRLDRKKTKFLIILSENTKLSGEELNSAIQSRLNPDLPEFTLRLTTLGHVVRGGSPTAFDRLLGVRFGYASVQLLLNGESGVMIGWKGKGESVKPLSFDQDLTRASLKTVSRQSKTLKDKKATLTQLFAIHQEMMCYKLNI
ncbi:MAG: ATP-dependent 6-phosphofructokinase [Deltaproteobacteria bacterium]|nr:ATP-dependent 6-phosphofructokinase [Deltaproteobacteria bacterium]